MPRRTVVCLLVLLSSLAVKAQTAPPTTPPAGQLDQTRSIDHPQLFSSFHQPLPEQYIWTHEASDTDASPDAAKQRNEPRYFRVRFRLATVPKEATLYIAGPQSAEVWINGSPAGHFPGDPLSRLSVQVFHADVAGLLHSGDNVLALKATKGDENLVVKVLPATPGIFAQPMLISGPEWRGMQHSTDGWQGMNFDDSSWPVVDADGSIEGNIDFFQWNADAGLYSWPGYEGASRFLAHVYLPAEKVLDVYAGQGSYENLDSLTTAGENATHEFTVKLDTNRPQDQFIPGITLDFGREVAGRVQVISDSDAPATITIAYGESLGELHNQPYLGVDVLHLNAHGSGVGPKSAFRYAHIRFPSGPAQLRFRAIRLEDIYYPVHYQGSFESSDPLLNRIWETGVYTSHLCMQDDIWDAPKRDRGRWMGDTDVSGRVIDAVFADHFLVEDTLTRLIGPLPIQHHVNTIPGYSSFWLTELADYLRHTGRKEYVETMHDHIVALLHFLDSDFDSQNQFINRTHEWLFVDWVLELNGDTPQARQTTVLEYIRAYREGAWLLRQVGDTKNAEHFAQRADQLAKVSQTSGWSAGSYGPRWQTNSMAVISGVATPEQYDSIWQNVLSNVGKKTYRPDVTTPYYGAYILDAMAQINHRAEALAWIREYWGGMIAEGATSFWEAYDPAWPKDEPHVVLQADNTAGYQTSLAHGWSSGPAFWLMEQVLGIGPTAPGFSHTTIRPDLIDLDWARGSEPTPHGILKVDVRKDNGLRASLDLPAGVEATVLFPVSPGTVHVLVNGTSRSGTPAENGARLAIVLSQPGHYEIHQ
jgi:alpha-L-rhamnosidase